MRSLIGSMDKSIFMNIGLVFCYFEVMIRIVESSVYNVIICDIR